MTKKKITAPEMRLLGTDCAMHVLEEAFSHEVSADDWKALIEDMHGRMLQFREEHRLGARLLAAFKVAFEGTLLDNGIDGRHIVKLSGYLLQGLKGQPLRTRP